MKKLILDEANVLTPQEKMDMWHYKLRGLNIAACGDQKLKMYYDICIKSRYSFEASQLIAEARKRGLSWAMNSKNTSTTTTTSFTPVFSLNDFTDTIANEITNNQDESAILLSCQNSIKLMFIYLLYAICLKRNVLIDKLKASLATALTPAECKQILSDLASNQSIMDKISATLIKAKATPNAQSQLNNLCSFKCTTGPVMRIPNLVTISSQTISHVLDSLAINGKLTKSDLLEVQFANTVEKIDDNAFFGCANLETITLPDNIIEVGNYAFADCTKLHKVVFGKNLQKIGQSAFEGCYALSELYSNGSRQWWQDTKALRGPGWHKNVPANVLYCKDGPVSILSEDLKLKESIEKHDTLNSKLWNIDTLELKPEVTEKINQIVTEFLDSLKNDEITINVKDVVIVGSNVSYNYTKDSDLDIHIIADIATLQCPEDLYNKIYSAYRSLFNKKLDIDFYGIPVELYVETEGLPRISNGVYSVMNNTWIKEPIKETIPEIDKAAFEKEFKIWEDRYNAIIKSTKKVLNEEINNQQIIEIDNFIDDIYALRKEGLATTGEYGLKNLVFKEVRNKGYLDNLKDLKNQLTSKELSLESLNESSSMEAAAQAEYESLIKEQDRLSQAYDAAENNPQQQISISLQLDKISKKIENLVKIWGYCLDINNDLAESIIEKQYTKYKTELSRISHNQAILFDSGLFKIYNIKAGDINQIINQIRNLSYVEWANKSETGKYDFSKMVIFGQLPDKYYEITGKIKD